MRKNISLNLILIFMFLLSGLLGVHDSFSKASKYGWYYTKTIIVENEIIKEEVNHQATLFSSLLLILAGVSFGHTIILQMPYSALPVRKDNYGLRFVSSKKTKDWFIEVLRPEEEIHVGIEDYVLAIPVDYVVENMGGQPSG